MRRSIAVISVVALLVAGCGRQAPLAAIPAADQVEPQAREDRLAPAVQLTTEGRPVEGGYLAVGDFDGDGRPDLLLGAGSEGRLAVYRTVGTSAALKLVGPQWFDDRVPTGRIPKG